jgi:synaptobrevin homolog YKT6
MYSLTIYKLDKEPITLYNAYYSSKFPFFARSNIKKILIEIGREIIKRIKSDTFYSIKVDKDNINGIVHGYVNNGIGCIIIDDNKNHTEHIKGFLKKSLMIMSEQASHYEIIKSDIYLTNKELDKFFIDGNDELKNDKLIQVRNEVDVTKAVILDSIDALLERGEKIEDLLIRNETLEKEAREYLKRTKDLNRCCQII